jgi:hypothetical protein
MTNAFAPRGVKVETTRVLQRCARSLALVVASALIVGGCSGGSTTAGLDKPNWSLADKAPVALGGPSGTVAPSAVQQDYSYRGGRDPVTGSVRADSAAGPRVIEIRKGDTLHGLSLTHHVSVKALMAANKLTSTTIQPGKTLIIPAS